jgi:hypothetical protein
MNGNSTKTGTRLTCAFASVLAIGAAVASISAIGAIGCHNGSTATTAFTTDPYVYYTNYPADISVASYYWVDNWVFTGLFASNATGGSGGPEGNQMTASGTAGTTGAVSSAAGAGGTAATPTIAPVVTTVADAIRALALGQDVCGSNVTVVPQTRTPVCTGGPTQTRAGATITFNNCQTPGGGLITGTVEIASSATASTTVCFGTTSVKTSHTTAITSLTYVGPDGIKAVIPLQTDAGTNTYNFGTTPPTITLTTTGRLQTYGSDGTLLSDTSYTGTPTISFGGSSSGYAIDGSFTTNDNRLNGPNQLYQLSGITRVASCCRPIAGTVRVATGDGDRDNASRTYTWGPTCGDLTLDGQILTSIPACL